MEISTHLISLVTLSSLLFASSDKSVPSPICKLQVAVLTSLISSCSRVLEGVWLQPGIESPQPSTVRGRDTLVPPTLGARHRGET